MSMSLSVIDAYEVTDITRQFLINWKVGVPLCRVASLQVFLLAHVDIFKASHELSHQHLLLSHLLIFYFLMYIMLVPPTITIYPWLMSPSQTVLEQRASTQPLPSETKKKKNPLYEHHGILW